MADVKTKVSRTAKGVQGEAFIQSFRNEEKRQDSLKIQDYRRMLDDGQVYMLWNAITNTILSAGFHVEDDPDFISAQTVDAAEDDTESVVLEKESSKEKQFIEQVLFTPASKGGLKRSFNAINRTMFRAFVEGFRCFELIYMNREDGMIGLKDVAPRAGKTDAEFHLITDDDGAFVGFRQQLTFVGRVIDITVRNTSEIPTVVKATYGEEFGSNYGRSGFKSAWYHYDKAHKGMYLNHIGHELGAVKVRNIKHNANTQKEVDDAVAEAAKIGVEGVWAMKQDFGELVFEDASDAGVMGVGKEMINMHYSLMAKSVLAQFVDLGSNISETGSRSLGDTQQEFFKVGLEAIAQIIIEETWNQIITGLIKANFNNGIFPTLATNPIADDQSELLLQTFVELVKKGSLTEGVEKEIISRVAEKLDLEITPEQIDQELEEQKADKEKDDQASQEREMELLKVKSTNTQLSEVKLRHDPMFEAQTTAGIAEASSDTGLPYVRPLFPDEEKVKIADIQRKMTDSQIEAESILRKKLTLIREELVDEYIKAIRTGAGAIKKVKINLNEKTKGEYSDALLVLGFALAEFGKVMAANELDVTIPNTTVKQKKRIQAQIEAIDEEQSARLKLRMTEAANLALASDMPENQAQIQLENEFNNFWAVVLLPTISAFIPRMINSGRAITFRKNEDIIFAYRYTAILDNRTTAFCENLDGRVFQANDPDYAMLTPPNHFGCRSFWTAITHTEAEEHEIRVTGKDVNFPVYGSLSTFRDVTDVANLGDTEKKLINLIDKFK